MTDNFSQCESNSNGGVQETITGTVQSKDKWVQRVTAHQQNL